MQVWELTLAAQCLSSNFCLCLPLVPSKSFFPGAVWFAALLSPPITRLKEVCGRKPSPKHLNLSIEGLGSLTDPLPPALGRGLCPQLLIRFAPEHSAGAQCKGCYQSPLLQALPAAGKKSATLGCLTAT